MCNTNVMLWQVFMQINNNSVKLLLVAAAAQSSVDKGNDSERAF